jgi:hypothetical protein
MNKLQELLRIDPERWKMSPKEWKIFWVDTMSMIIFSLVIGTLADIFLARLNTRQLIRSRLIAMFLNLILTPYYYRYQRKVRGYFPDFKNESLLIRYMVDTFVYGTFQGVTSFLFLRFVAGATYENIRNTITVVVLLSFLLGYANSQFNALLRRIFKVPLAT